MAKQKSTSITSNGDHLIGYAMTPRNFDEFKGHVRISGTWGGGTATIKTSDDGGATKIAETDQSGSVWSATADTAVPIVLPGSPDATSSLAIYVTLSGATSPDLTATLFDNVNK